MCDWVCYLLMSLDSRDTYIGSTNSLPRRLNNHNNNNPRIKRRGARRTRGQTWVPIIFITGFESKNACLSFETGWKRLHRKRNNSRLSAINTMCDTDLSYSRDTHWNRILDLVYFLHHFTYFAGKFKMNHAMKFPFVQPPTLCINIFMEDWISDLPWPFFMETKIISNQ